MAYENNPLLQNQIFQQQSLFTDADFGVTGNVFCHLFCKWLQNKCSLCKVAVYFWFLKGKC